MRTRTGKIARLPRPLRHALNQRLEQAEPGEKILAWLNGLPETQKILEEDFEGQPITKQNLSHWREGGFRDWLAREALRAGLRDARDFTEDWEEGEELDVIDRAATLLAARFATLLSRWDGRPDREFSETARALHDLCRSVTRLQGQMHRARADNHNFDRQLEREHKEQMADLRQQVVQPFFDLAKVPHLAGMFGGGELGTKIARYILAVLGGRNRSQDAKLDITPEEIEAETNPKPKEKRVQKKKPFKPKQSADKPLEDNEMKDSEPAVESDPVQGSPALNSAQS